MDILAVGRLTSTSNGWTDDLQFNILFSGISVISGQWEGDNERLCATDPVYN